MNKQNKILYVDDESINLELFKMNLQNHYDVFTAINGFEGLDILDRNPYIPLIISDMKMPIMNGIEFITKAKALYPDKRFFI